LPAIASDSSLEEQTTTSSLTSFLLEDVGDIWVMDVVPDDDS
jgi:hypothetical protein